MRILDRGRRSFGDDFTRGWSAHGDDRDDKARQAGLRFDLRDAAIKTLKSGERAIVPGDSAKSELIARITVKDGDGVMPKGIPQGLRHKILVENPLATYDRLNG